MNEPTPKVPKYQQIVDDMTHKINTGELSSDAPLPTQVELARMYSTSEITSRRALSELVQAGLIYRIRKKGSFVSGSGHLSQGGLHATGSNVGTAAAAQVEQSRTDSMTEQDDLNPTAPDSPTPAIAMSNSPTLHTINGRETIMERIYFMHPHDNLHLFTQGLYTQLIDGIYQVCGEQQIDFRVIDFPQGFGLPDDPHAGYVLLSGGQDDGANYMAELKRWKQDKRRMVTAQFFYPHLHIPYVIGDNLTGGYLATHHLIALGHTRIGIILTGKSGIDMNPEFSQRFQGYRLALANHKLTFDPQLVSVVDGEQEDESMGHVGFKQLMALPERPTAIFATSDYKAFGVMAAARDAGISIPDELSLVGYDGEDLGQFVVPRLTTVKQNMQQFGRRSAEMLLFEWEPDKPETDREIIVPQLIVRESAEQLRPSR